MWSSENFTWPAPLVSDWCCARHAKTWITLLCVRPLVEVRIALLCGSDDSFSLLQTSPVGLDVLRMNMSTIGMWASRSERANDCMLVDVHYPQFYCSWFLKEFCFLVGSKQSQLRKHEQFIFGRVSAQAIVLTTGEQKLCAVTTTWVRSERRCRVSTFFVISPFQANIFIDFLPFPHLKT